jgi:hypothetical protein
MSRSLNNSRCLLLLSALTAMLLWLVPARSVRAAVYTYNARQRTLNAGVLFVGSASDSAVFTANTPNPVPDPAPYVFYVLDQRPDVKPVGWSFVNPLAQSTVTTAMSTRWNGVYKAGDSLTPTMASYWEVALRDVSADDLQQFDVLYLSASGVGFLPADNEKLRRFVDNGGQLIVEYGGPVGSPLLFDSANWSSGAATSSLMLPLAPSSSSLYDLHPLIMQPNFLQPGDFLFLGEVLPAGGGFGTLKQNTQIFGTVLLQGSADAVDAAQLGGGQIVTSALNIGPAVCGNNQGAILPTTFNPAAVPSVNFKFLSNIISWADTHPNENKTSHQNAAGPSSASYTAAWNYPVAGSTSSTPPPPGAAVWGDYVFVTDSTGVLHAFDAIPDESLTGGTSADDGPLLDFGSATAPTPYDEVWNSGKSLSSVVSAPTAFSFDNQTLVMVEDRTGVVYVYYAVTGKPWATAATLNKANANGSFAGFVPAPTYYDGRVYAGQPDGTLFVYTLNQSGSAGGGAFVPVDPQNVSGESATASPAVGVLASGTATNSIVALVPTTQNMNTVLLGARNDPLIGYSPNGQFAGYNVNRNARYSLPNLFVDTAANPIGHAYDSFGNFLAPENGTGQDPVYPTINQSTNIDDQFGDWDIDFVKSIPQNGGMTLTLHEIKALSFSNTVGGGATLSAPAIDRKGDYYYVVNAGADSYLFGVHDDIAQRNVRLKFRFRLPKSGDLSTVDPTSGTQWSTPGNAVDADNVNYANTTTNPDGSSRSLLDYHFVGAPVVDGQGNVYVAAQQGTAGPAAVLSFNADQEVTAVPLGPGASGFDATQAHYFQLDEAMGNPQNPLVAIPLPRRGAGRYGQITTAGSVASVFNFGRGSGGSRQIAGNLCEPQPFTATPNLQAGVSTGTAMWMYFHTNLAWYATFAVNGPISGLSKAGSTLLLCDSGGGSSGAVGSGSYNTLYKLPAAPTIGAGKLAALTVRKAPLGTGANGQPLYIGTVTAAPSAGGGAMVVNGTAGLAAFNQQLTLIADNNRILEADADGNAVWSADATTRAGGNGVSTKVDFAHPSALAQFAPNDYLVADTGNNRCVRFDRGGSVLWELTRFYDPGALMAPGQPFTLSQPTSVEVRREAYPYTLGGTSYTGSLVHYLVADSGNDRIVEVTDTVDAAGNVLSFDLSGKVVLPGTSGSVTHDHLLSWVTHTGDKYGRRYHYAGASYLDIPSGTVGTADTIQVFALVTNTRVAQLGTGGQFAPASADAPGGSIVAFNRPPAPVAFSAITNVTPNDLVYVATTFTAPVTTGATTNILTFPVRNPRYLHVYAPPQGIPTVAAPYAYSFLYADDNGAFDLVYQGQAKPPVSYGLAFTQTDYRNMTVPADVAGNVPLRGGSTTSSPMIPPIPFVPTCVQRLNDDDTNTPVVSHIERYLITQSYSQGELARQPGVAAPKRLGGEIFEVDVSTTVSGGVTTAVTQVPAGGFAGAVTLSRPVGASPLTQPTFAIRTTQ